MQVNSYLGATYRTVKYSVDHFWRDGRQVYQAWYDGKTTGEFMSHNRALAKAKQVAETIRRNYMQHGTPARTLFVDPNILHTVYGDLK